LPLFTDVLEGALSEDEMRRPTPYAVPLEGLQRLCGLSVARGPNERRIGP
jgi:hypothetical protein